MKFSRVILGWCLFLGTLSMSIQNKTLDDGKYVTVEMFESMKRNMTKIISDLSSRVPEKSPVYFYVTLTSDRTYHYNSIVRFNNVIYNQGNHFNVGDSVFVVPATGVYLFSWTIHAYNGKNVYTELRVANAVKGRLNMNLGSSTGYFSSTRVIICTADKDDHVWIQTSGHSTENYFDDYSSSRSSFMGVLLSNKT